MEVGIWQSKEHSETMHLLIIAGSRSRRRRRRNSGIEQLRPNKDAIITHFIMASL